MVFQSYLKLKRAGRIASLAMVIFCCLVIGSTNLLAVDYVVFGQVFRVTSDELAEKQQAADDADISLDLNTLEKQGLPFVHIRIYNKTSGKLLAEGDAGINGQFNITVSLTTPPPGPDVECRVYKAADGQFLQQPEVKTGVNTIIGIGAFNQAKLMVINDDIIDYEDALGPTDPGVGLLFSRVGKVTVNYIDQDAASGLNRGMADVPAAAPAYIPRFKRAPFGGGLLIFGDFGTLKPACAGKTIDWYKVTVTNLTTPSVITLKDNLSKVKTTVSSSAPLTVTNSTEKLGPYTGKDNITLANIDGLYKVNKNTGTVFYSYPDLRMYWNTSGQNGLYEITVEYYHKTGGTPTQPVVEKLSAACFDPVAPNTPIGKLIVRVNNQPLDVTFDGIYLKTGGGTYYEVSGSKYDFNKEGLCSIMNLKVPQPLPQPPIKYGIEIDFTAHHTGNYMRSYSLSAISNDKAVNVSFDSQGYATHVSAADPRWFGTAVAGDTKFQAFGSFPQACAYIIDLIATSRVQNGYNYIQRVHKRRAYYIDPN
ncbi:MAG: hypothetical protein GY940_01245 [bacterium]|nr:hypothetical protein [bacterium]